MNYPTTHKVPAAPEGKEWYPVKEGNVERGDWIGLIKAYADGLIGDKVLRNWSVYRLRDIPAKEALALTKPVAKSETELLRAEVAALKVEVADLKEKRELDRKDREALEDKLAAARAAVQTLKSI